jgi:hypothetical protein
VAKGENIQVAPPRVPIDEDIEKSCVSLEKLDRRTLEVVLDPTAPERRSP